MANVDWLYMILAITFRTLQLFIIKCYIVFADTTCDT